MDHCTDDTQRAPRDSKLEAEIRGPEAGECWRSKGEPLVSQPGRSLTPEQEFDSLGEEETIYKLVGPVLLKQEKFEAENTVKGRLDFINGEM